MVCNAILPVKRCTLFALLAHFFIFALHPQKDNEIAGNGGISEPVFAP